MKFLFNLKNFIAFQSYYTQQFENWKKKLVEK